MNPKKIQKTIGYVAATAALCALGELFAAYAFKASDYETFKDDHYKMDFLKGQLSSEGISRGAEKSALEKRLDNVHKEHQSLQEPIKTLVWGKIPNKCPICKDRE